MLGTLFLIFLYGVESVMALNENCRVELLRPENKILFYLNSATPINSLIRALIKISRAIKALIKTSSILKICFSNFKALLTRFISTRHTFSHYFD